MESNDPGSSAPDFHGELPRLPPAILGAAHEIVARNAEMYREAPPPI
jgi:hypothetical protein